MADFFSGPSSQGDELRGLLAQATDPRQRALLAYAAYAGYFQLLRTTPEAVAAVTDLSGYVRRLADALVPTELR